MEREEQGIEGAELVRGIVRRRWRVAALSILGIFCPAFTVVWFLPDIYRSSATVLIERQQIPDDLVKSTVTSALETRLQTISQEIFSRARLEGLIDRFGLYEDMKKSEPIEAVIERMRKDISLELTGSGQRGNTTTVAFTVSYKGSNAQRVAVVTNTLASFYIEENLKVREEQASATSQFFRLQLQQAQQELQEIEQRLSDFKRAHVGQLPHQQEGNLGSLEQLNTRLRLNSDKQIRTTELINGLEQQIAVATTPVTGPDATAARIEELRMMLRELRKRYSDRYPDVVRVKAEIAALVERLAEQSEPGTVQVQTPDSPQVAELRQQLNSAKAEMTALRFEAEQLQRATAEYEQKLDMAPLAEQQFQILTRNYETSTELYRSLLLRQKEAELAENMEQRQKGEQFRIVDPAFPSEVPAAPNRPVLWAIAAILALAAGGGVGVLLEQLDTSFHSQEDLRKTSGVPLLVSVPRILTGRDRRRRALRFVVATASSFVGLAILVGASYWLALGNERLATFLMR